MIVARAEDQKAPSLQPFDRGSAVHDDARNGRMCRLGDTAPHESVERLERWFTREDDMYGVDERLRALVELGRHNLVRDPVPPLGRGPFDLILCRNVVIYFDLPTVSFFWVEEVGEFGLAWLTLIGAAVAIAERTHFALAVLTHRLSPRAQRIVVRLNHLMIAGFGAIAAGYGIKLSMINAVLESPGLGINLAVLYAAAVAGGVLMVVYGLGVAFGLTRLRETADPGGI